MADVNDPKHSTKPPDEPPLQSLAIDSNGRFLEEVPDEEQ